MSDLALLEPAGAGVARLTLNRPDALNALNRELTTALEQSLDRVAAMDDIRVLVICGRDEVDPSEPSADQISNQIAEERINLRWRRYLSDLRRDAVIEFR